MHHTTDLRVTADDVLVLHHDAVVGRSTNGSGDVAFLPYDGRLEHVRTRHAKPALPIPTFGDLCDVLMEPGAQHVHALVCPPPFRAGAGCRCRRRRYAETSRS